MLQVSGPTSSPATSATTGRRRSASSTASAGTSPATWREIDADGFISFRGRLKRFLKAGGEMISLPALEEPFVAAVSADRRGAARGGRGHRDARRPAHRAVHDGADHAARRQRAAARGGIPRRDAAGRSAARSTRSRCWARARPTTRCCGPRLNPRNRAVLRLVATQRGAWGLGLILNIFQPNYSFCPRVPIKIAGYSARIARRGRGYCFRIVRNR